MRGTAFSTIVLLFIGNLALTQGLFFSPVCLKRSLVRAMFSIPEAVRSNPQGSFLIA